MRAIYDLKGSSVNREVKGEDLKPTSTLKDVNLKQHLREEPDLVNFESLDKIRLSRILRKDVEFLRSKGIMDYSLLLGIEKTSKDLDRDTLHQIDAPRYSTIKSTDSL